MMHRPKYTVTVADFCKSWRHESFVVGPRVQSRRGGAVYRLCLGIKNLRRPPIAKGMDPSHNLR